MKHKLTSDAASKIKRVEEVEEDARTLHRKLQIEDEKTRLRGTLHIRRDGAGTVPKHWQPYDDPHPPVMPVKERPRRKFNKQSSLKDVFTQVASKSKLGLASSSASSVAYPEYTSLSRAAGYTKPVQDVSTIAAD